MASWFEVVNSYFWSNKYWFPEGKSWKLVENKPGGKYHAQVHDLYGIFPMAVFLLVLRFLFERYIARPIAIYYGLREGTILYPTPNKLLEKAYKKSKRPDDKQLQGLSKQTDWSYRQVERWYRKRRNQDRSSELKKFTETAWRFVFYLLIFIYGLVTTSQKPYFLDTTYCWEDWPDQHVTDEMYWYYMIELGFYFSLMFSLCLDVKRKDFTEQVVHHVTTILLMSISWVNNFVRIGTLILVLHDAVDYWMEGAKLAKYLKKDKLCDVLFVMFALVWFVTRLLIFPFWILHSSLIEAPLHCGMAPIYYTYSTLMCCLQVLHCIWFYLILKAGYIALKTGKVQKDERSETEEDVSDDSGDSNPRKGRKTDTNANSH